MKTKNMVDVEFSEFLRRHFFLTSHKVNQLTGLPPFRMILFLLLPVAAVVNQIHWDPVVVMADPHYKLPVCSVKYTYEIFKAQHVKP
jgi:hypothetical protein